MQNIFVDTKHQNDLYFRCCVATFEKMRKEQMSMKLPPFSQKVDATQYLSCATCPCNYNCAKYALICDFTHQHLYFSAKLLCILENAEKACDSLRYELNKIKTENVSVRVNCLYDLFLPKIFNYWRAVEIYESARLTSYARHALVLTLCECLDYHNDLQLFDFLFETDLQNLREEVCANYTSEIQKPENQLNGSECAREN